MFPRGIYVLVIELPKIKIEVGKLGKIEFEGKYAYLGSAQKKGRIERHLKRGKKKRWHIDYLTEVGEIKKIIVIENVGREKEEELARALEKFEHVKNFGNSDCKDRSHLFKYSKDLEEEILKFCKKIKARALFYELK